MQAGVCMLAFFCYKFKSDDDISTMIPCPSRCLSGDESEPVDADVEVIDVQVHADADSELIEEVVVPHSEVLQVKASDLVLCPDCGEPSQVEALARGVYQPCVHSNGTDAVLSCGSPDALKALGLVICPQCCESSRTRGYAVRCENVRAVGLGVDPDSTGMYGDESRGCRGSDCVGRSDFSFPDFSENARGFDRLRREASELDCTDGRNESNRSKCPSTHHDSDACQSRRFNPTLAAPVAVKPSSPILTSGGVAQWQPDYSSDDSGAVADCNDQPFGPPRTVPYLLLTPLIVGSLDVPDAAAVLHSQRTEDSDVLYVNEVDLELASNLVFLSDIEALAATTYLSKGRDLASRLDSVQFTAARLSASGLFTVSAIVASEKADKSVYKIELEIGPRSLKGRCECPGCNASATAGLNLFGKHIVAALLVLSHETAFTACKSLSFFHREDEADCVSDVQSSEEASSFGKKEDARSKSLALSAGVKRTYPPKPSTQTFPVPRDRVNTIFDFDKREWAPGKGVAADRIRALLKEVDALGSQCAPGFNKRFARVLTSVLQRRTRGAAYYNFYCQALHCPLTGSVSFTPGEVGATDAVEMTVTSSGSCQHYVKEELYGFGELRNETRVKTVEHLTALVTTGAAARRGGPTAYYNESLIDAEPNRSGSSSAVSISVMRKAVRESKCIQKDSDLLTSLFLMQRATQDEVKSEIYLQQLVLEPNNVKALLFTSSGLELYRRSLQQQGAIFVDTTGKVVADVSVHPSQGAKPMMTTALHVPVPNSLERNSRPYRVMTELSLKTVSSTLAASLLHMRSCELAIFGNNRMPKFISADCGLSLLIALMLVYNDTKYKHYASVMLTEVRNGKTASDVATSMSWAIYAWCKYHVKKAIRDYCTGQLQATVFISKADKSALTLRIFEHVRTAPTIAEIDSRIEVVRKLLGSSCMSDVFDLPGMTYATCAAGAVIVFTLEGISLSVTVSADVMNFDEESLSTMPNPFADTKTLSYLDRQWFNPDHLVFWTEVFISGCTRKCDATSEVGFNQIKHWQHYAGLRVDEFIFLDQKVDIAEVQRFVDEEQKRAAAGGQSVGDAVRALGAVSVPVTVEASESWAKGPAKGVSRESMAAVDNVNDARHAMAAREARTPSCEIVRLRIMFFIFEPGNAKLEAHMSSSVFNNSSTFSTFLNKKRNMKPSVIAAINRWASVVRDGSLQYKSSRTEPIVLSATEVVTSATTAPGDMPVNNLSPTPNATVGVPIVARVIAGRTEPIVLSVTEVVTSAITAPVGAATTPVISDADWFSANVTPELEARFAEAVLIHPVRNASIARAKNGSDSDSSLEDDGNIYSDFGAVFYLRNSTSVSGGRVRAITRANAGMAAVYASQILEQRGFVVCRGDAESMLCWLEQPSGSLPEEHLWRSMTDVE